MLSDVYLHFLLSVCLWFLYCVFVSCVLCISLQEHVGLDKFYSIDIGDNTLSLPKRQKDIESGGGGGVAISDALNLYLKHLFSYREYQYLPLGQNVFAAVCLRLFNLPIDIKMFQ